MYDELAQLLKNSFRLFLKPADIIAGILLNFQVKLQFGQS